MWGLFNRVKDATCQIKEKLVEKDPSDRRLCKSSTAWKHERYCPNCYATTQHDEFMTRICLSCGEYDREMIFSDRAYRQIFYQGKWRVQRSYKNELIMAGDEAKQ